MTLTEPRPPSAPFPLLDDVIAIADAAMQAGSPKKIVAALVADLRNIVSAGGALPPELLTPEPDGYVRRALYRSDRFGYQILALTWGPGHASAVHDHGDTWGVEAVLRGRLEVVDYAASEEKRAITRLLPKHHHALVDGDVIGLLPPHDLHACRNADPRDTAVTLHIYGTPLDAVRRYVQIEDGLYRPERASLATV